MKDCRWPRCVCPENTCQQLFVKDSTTAAQLAAKDAEIAELRRTVADAANTVTHQGEMIHRRDAEIARLRKALTKIACFGDYNANSRLRNTGSYSGFDEPCSVQIARAALKEDTNG